MPNPIINRRLGAGGSLSSGGGGLPQSQDLILKLESTDFDSTADNTNITLWTDRSGWTADMNGNSTSGAPGNPPTVDGSRLCNGHKTVRFSGSNVIGRNGALNFTATPGAEMMVVNRVDNAVPSGAGNRFFELLIPSLPNAGLQPFDNGTFFESFARTDRPAVGTPVTDITKFYCYNVTAKSDGTLYAVWCNSEALFSANSGYTFNNTPISSIITLGAVYSGVSNLYSNGNIAAVYCWKQSLSTSDRALARAYIAAMWGITF